MPFVCYATELKNKQIVHQGTTQGKTGRGKVELCLLLNIALAGYASMIAATIGLVWSFLLA